MSDDQEDKSTLEVVVDTVSDVSNTVVNTVSDTSKAVVDTVSDVSEVISNTAVSSFSMISGLLSSKATKAADSVRNMHETYPSKAGLKIHADNINRILSEMHVSRELKEAVMHNVKNSNPIVRDLIRTVNILSTLQEHGLSGKCADEFLKGGHFRLKDGAELFNKLKEQEGAEERFSSHFTKTKTKEFGISSGRILPEVLFLETIMDGEHYSHFQSEASPWRMKSVFDWDNLKMSGQTLQNAEHIPDSIWYGVNKAISQLRGTPVMNLSNYGWSEYDDAHPISSMNELPLAPVEEVDTVADLLGSDLDLTASNEYTQPGPSL